MKDALRSAILTFTPVYKPYLWGGASLPARLGRTHAPALDRYAESWELSDHPDGMSVAEEGPFRGLTLGQLVREHGRALTGSDDPGFPLLVKILDAAERLSVQVHPDNEGARRHGGDPKTECWYILDAAPGAGVWAGLEAGATPAGFQDALATGRVENLLRRVPVKPGDLLYIPGGRIHAIGEGCLILEVQQSSNTTYRVFDWNRLGPDGQPRALHVEQALKIIRWDDPDSPVVPPGQSRRLGRNTLTERLACPYFSLEEMELEEPLEVNPAPPGFTALFVVAGRLTVEPGEEGPARSLPRGATALLPAAMPRYRLSPGMPGTRIIRITRPCR